MNLKSKSEIHMMILLMSVEIVSGRQLLGFVQMSKKQLLDAEVEDRKDCKTNSTNTFFELIFQDKHLASARFEISNAACLMQVYCAQDGKLLAAVRGTRPLKLGTALHTVNDGMETPHGSCRLWSTPGVERVEWVMQGEQTSVECRTSRAWLPKTDLWLFKPRCFIRKIMSKCEYSAFQ